jgi:hypothetical protein
MITEAHQTLRDRVRRRHAPRAEESVCDYCICMYSGRLYRNFGRCPVHVMQPRYNARASRLVSPPVSQMRPQVSPPVHHAWSLASFPFSSLAMHSHPCARGCDCCCCCSSFTVLAREPRVSCVGTDRRPIFPNSMHELASWQNTWSCRRKMPVVGTAGRLQHDIVSGPNGVAADPCATTTTTTALRIISKAI